MLRLSKKTLKCIAVGVFSALLIAVFCFVPKVWKLKNDTHRILRGDVEVTVGPSQESWVPLASLSGYMKGAILAQEDDRFYEHSGVSFREIFKSIGRNLQAGTYRRGASTITQQLIKMAFLTPEKTLTRKAREISGALLVEKILAKDEILEWYLNLARFGESVYGIGPAAMHYFRKKPAELTLSECVHLAILLPSPRIRERLLSSKTLPEFWLRRFERNLDRQIKTGWITEADREMARNEIRR